MTLANKGTDTAQKVKSSMKDSFILQVWSHLLKKSLMENFIFCVMGGAV